MNALQSGLHLTNLAWSNSMLILRDLWSFWFQFLVLHIKTERSEIKDTLTYKAIHTPATDTSFVKQEYKDVLQFEAHTVRVF
jgi:hypothetical protein